MDLLKAKEILKPCIWEHPESYGGHSPIGDYVVYSRNRDSSILEDTNYNIILDTLKKIDTEVYDFRAHHWACGWVEYIILPQNASLDAIIEAAQIISDLSDYPIIDDQAYSDAQYEVVCDYWDNMRIRERVEYCRDSGESIFAARSKAIPSGVFNTLCEEIY